MMFSRPENHPPALGASLFDAAGEPSRELQKEPILIRVLEGMPLHRRLRQSPFPAEEAGVEPVSVRKASRDVAGEFIDLTRRVSERTCRYPYGSPQGHRLD